MKMLTLRRLIVLLGCCWVLDANADGGSFVREIVPLFKSRCVMCHLPPSGQGGLALHPNGGYANLVGIKSTQSPLLLVDPGAPQKSYLYLKLMGTHTAAGGSGERMPFGDAALSTGQIEAVRRWIENGARND